MYIKNIDLETKYASPFRFKTLDGRYLITNDWVISTTALAVRADMALAAA